MLRAVLLIVIYLLNFTIYQIDGDEVWVSGNKSQVFISSLSHQTDRIQVAKSSARKILALIENRSFEWLSPKPWTVFDKYLSRGLELLTLCVKSKEVQSFKQSHALIPYHPWPLQFNEILLI